MDVKHKRSSVNTIYDVNLWIVSVSCIAKELVQLTCYSVDPDVVIWTCCAGAVNLLWWSCWTFCARGFENEALVANQEHLDKQIHMRESA